MACGGCGNRNNEVAIPQRIPNVKEPTGETTQCQCQFPDGEDTIFCERHQCTKTRPLHHLCKHREDYFQLWEDGHGPMHNARATLSQPPQPPELPNLNEQQL